ncbi:MAG: large conductance mechanosensitive channel protein MscL [Synergistes sp.]|nr:large conductance mechanosensitive channel protein MscL [Synergistes sp.]
MKKLFKDFCEFFTSRGNMLGMAVGIIIGKAVSDVVGSVVTDLLMPVIGLVIGDVDFSSLFINLSGTPVTTLEEARKAGLPVISYGVFLNNLITFLIISAVIFSLFKAMDGVTEKIKSKNGKPEEPEKEPRLCPYCFGEIDERATRCPHCTAQLTADASK